MNTTPSSPMSTCAEPGWGRQEQSTVFSNKTPDSRAPYPVVSVDVPIHGHRLVDQFLDQDGMTSMQEDLRNPRLAILIGAHLDLASPLYALYKAYLQVSRLNQVAHDLQNAGAPPLIISTIRDVRHDALGDICVALHQLGMQDFLVDLNRFVRENHAALRMPRLFLGTPPHHPRPPTQLLTMKPCSFRPRKPSWIASRELYPFYPLILNTLMHASNVITWDTSERTVPSTNAPCVSIGPQATLKCIAHFAVEPTHRPPPPPLPLLPAIPLPLDNLAQYLLRNQADVLAARLHVSHLMPTPVADEATILHILHEAETLADPTPQRRSTTAPLRPTSPDPREESTETTRWSFFGDLDLVWGYCYELPLATLSRFYDNFSSYVSSSSDSVYNSL